MSFVIDFHTHFYPAKVAARAVENVRRLPGANPQGDGTKAALLESMQRCHIDKSVVLPVAGRPENSRSINEWARGENTESLIMFGSVHPQEPDLAERIAELKSAGVLGIKLHPEYQEFRFSMAQLDVLAEACVAHNMIVMTHAGADIGFPEPWRSNPEELLAFHQRHKKLVLVLAHLGSWLMFDQVEKLVCGERVFLDTAFLDSYITPEQLLRIIRQHGSERVLMGSDFPWMGQDSTLKMLDSLDLTGREKEMIYGDNAAELLGLI